MSAIVWILLAVLICVITSVVWIYYPWIYYPKHRRTEWGDQIAPPDGWNYRNGNHLALTRSGEQISGTWVKAPRTLSRWQNEYFKPNSWRNVEQVGQHEYSKRPESYYA
jgi:hypothetical protein